MSPTLAELTELLLRFREERSWAQFHNPKDMALSLMLESAELLEHMQWKNGPELLDSLRAHREAVGDELADVLHWVLLIANDLNINLGEAAKQKIAKNAAKYPVDKAAGIAKKYTEL